MKNIFKFFLPLFAIAITFSACFEEDFDNPPVTGSDPGLEVTTTIAELNAMHTFGTVTEIEDDLIIRGTVVADDFTGNWFRSFVIQDETGGITVLIDIAESYVFYPEGREVYIRLKGLAVSDYNNLTQLGVYNSTINEVEEIGNVSDHLIQSVTRTLPEPEVLTINQLTIDHVNTLVQLEGVEFANTNTTFADAPGLNTINLDLEDCNGNTVIVRTSGYSDFASQTVPQGNGTFVGILSVFRDDFQLLVRRPADLLMSGDRCDGGSGSGGGGTGCDSGVGPLVVEGVDEGFENGSNNDAVAITGWTNYIVKGSRDWIYKEFDGNVYVQSSAFNDSAPEMESWLVTPLIDLTEPQVLTFETAQAFYTHDGFSAWLSTDYNCDPTTATWQPLPGATLAGAGTPSNEWVPSGEIDLTALVGQEVAIGFKYVGSGPSGQTGSFRVDNVKLGEPGSGGGTGGGGNPVDCPDVDDVDVNFDGGNNNDPIALSGWENVAAKGTRTWIYKEFDGNMYTQATAFNDSEPEAEMWLVSPLINVTAGKTLSFETAQAFWTHNGLSVFISTNYECDPLTATWDPLNATLAMSSDPEHEWIPSGNIDLSSYAGQQIAIGFRYIGSGPGGETASYRVDNIVVE